MKKQRVEKTKKNRHEKTTCRLNRHEDLDLFG